MLRVHWGGGAGRGCCLTFDEFSSNVVVLEVRGRFDRVRVCAVKRTFVRRVRRCAEPEAAMGR